jgi:hypothetical protein
MKEIAVRIFDDLDYHESQVRHEACATLTIGLNGAWRELDLTEVNEKKVRDTLEPLMAAGREPEKPPVPPEAVKRTDPVRAEYMRKLREWVRAAGLRNKEGTGWAYQTGESLSYYYSRELLDRYQAHLDEQARQ